jgi:hypothetical protein
VCKRQGRDDESGGDVFNMLKTSRKNQKACSMLKTLKKRAAMERLFFYREKTVKDGFQVLPGDGV